MSKPLRLLSLFSLGGLSRYWLLGHGLLIHQAESLRIALLTQSEEKLLLCSTAFGVLGVISWGFAVCCWFG